MSAGPHNAAIRHESPKRPMPFDKAWKIAMQIADALPYPESENSHGRCPGYDWICSVKGVVLLPSAYLRHHSCH
jgi:hypothetical protein